MNELTYSQQSKQHKYNQFIWKAFIQTFFTHCLCFTTIMNDTQTPHSSQPKPREANQNYLIVNSFSKHVLSHNKKYMTNKKISLAKHSFLKAKAKHDFSHHYQASKSASVVNLQFQQGKSQQNIKGVGKKYPTSKPTPHQRKTNNFSTLQQASRKIVKIYRQNQKTKYHQLFKQSVEDFFKNTLQIGPYAKSLLKGKQVDDTIMQRKLINIEKVAFPLRQTRMDRMRNKTSYSRVNQTTRVEPLGVDEMNPNATHTRIKSFADHRQLYMDEQSYSDRRPQSLQRKCPNPALQTLIPARRPTNKKDYFVFGMSDRTGSSQNKIQMYRDMLWKLNYSSGLFVFTPQNMSGSGYKCYIGPGNNCNLIKGIMKRRFWWTITTNKNEQGVNFMWTQLKINTFYKIQYSNIQPQYVQINPRKGTRVQSSEQQSTFQPTFTDVAMIFNPADLNTWIHHYKKNQKSQRIIMQNTYKRRTKLYQKKPISRIQDSTLVHMHNHLQCNYYIGNKKALFYNIKRFSQLQGKNPFTMIPHTFHIKKGAQDPDWKKFLAYHSEMESLKKSQGPKGNFRNMWICKPGENTNRGNGITVCYSLDDIKIRLNGRQKNRDGQLRTFILQKYLQNPMLYQKRKFDIRHYALITCINGIFKFYWYQQGYIRTSSSQFSLKCNRDPLIHLTNDAIQKNTPDYGKYQKGNKLSYQQFQKYLQTTYPTKRKNFFEQILPKMREYATEAFRATYWGLDEKRLGSNFELLGLDFMIDENFQPWLIQVNTNPCLELSSPLLGRIIPHLIQNVLRICIDPLFPPPQQWPANKKTFFSQTPLSQNKFTLTFDQTVHGREVQDIYKDYKRIDLAMGKIEQQDQTYEDEGKEDWEEKNS